VGFWAWEEDGRVRYSFSKMALADRGGRSNMPGRWKET
jgi:hypothetical protein